MNKKHLEQHFLLHTDAYAALLDRLDFGSRAVVEIGVGTGVLTQLLAKRVGYQRIIGYEIDPAVVPPDLIGKIDLRLEDVTMADLSYLNESDFALVANPPYSLLPWIKKHFVERFPGMPMVLMFPQGMQAPPGFEQHLTISGSGFQPATTKNHAVFSRGFAISPGVEIDKSGGG